MGDGQQLYVRSGQEVMRTFYVTIEGLVSRIERVQAINIAEAMTEAKEEFIAKTGALNAVVVTANEEKTNG